MNSWRGLFSAIEVFIRSPSLERALYPCETLVCLFLQWDLVCERKGLNRVASTFFFIGVLVGAVVFGYLSDRWSEVWGE